MDSKLRSDEAARLLSNNVLLEALDELRKETVARWADCPARDTEGREWLWMFYQNTLRFEQVLKGYIGSGTIDQINKKQDTWMKNVSNIFKRK